MVAAALSSAGLRPPEALFLRYPHELSGGQRQRVLIAGALALQPQLLIADEPVSSLDASIRGEILALLLKLREELGLGVLVVTHDLGLAWNIADRIAVMYLGRVVEAGPTEEVLTAPQHPYTQALLSVVPEMEGLEPIVLRGEIPDPTRIPSGCRFHPRCPALASGEADAVADLCRGTSLPILPSDPDGHRSACHLVAARVSTARPGRSPTRRGDAMTLQAALPRELYVDPESFERERERVLLREWTCVGRVADLGLDQPERVAVVDVLGESVVLTADADGALHAAYNVCRHRGSQLFPTEPGQRRRSCAARSRSAAPTTRGPTPSTARCCAPRTPRTATSSPADFSLHPLGVEAWGGFVFVHPTPDAAAPLSDSVGRATRTLANYDLASLVTGQTYTYEVAANWKVVAENYNECYHCGPVHPELSRLVPSFAGGGQGLDWDEGIPHREGAWTFTMSGTTDALAAARAERGREGAPQGRAGLPEPDAVVLGRPRRRVHAATARRRPDRDRVPAALRRRPRWRHPASTRRTPVTSGTWSTARTGRSASRSSAGCRRGPTRTAGSRRWRTTPPTSAAGSSRGWARLRRSSLSRLVRPLVGRATSRPRPMTDVDYVVVGLGALGSGAAWHLASRGHSVLGLEQFELGHSRGASHDTSRILRHSYHTPAYVRLTQEAYDDWERLEKESGESLVTVVGGLDLFPPDCVIAPDDYVASLREVGIDFEELTRRGDRRPLPGVLACRPARAGCSRSAARSSRPRGAPPPCSGSRPRPVRRSSARRRSPR